MDLNTLLLTAGLLLVIGGFAGVLAGLLGVGGGIVLVPAFFYAFGGLGFGGDQLMQLCLATSLATIIVTSIRSVTSHNKKGAVEWSILRAWAPGIMVGSVIGVLIAAEMRTPVLQLIFGVLGFVISLYFLFFKQEWRLADDLPRTFGRLIASPVIGFLSVLMGIGGGSLGVPFMTLHGVPIHRAVATAAGFGLAIAVPSVIGFLFLEVADAPPWTIGAVNLPAFLLVIAMTLMTAPLGVKLAHRMDAKPLKRVFGVFLFFVTVNMLRKALVSLEVIGAGGT